MFYCTFNLKFYLLIGGSEPLATKNYQSLSTFTSAVFEIYLCKTKNKEYDAMNVLGFITKPHFTIFLKQYFTIPSKDILDFALRMMWGEITSTLYKAFTLLP